jgi:hypothetical protein
MFARLPSCTKWVLGALILLALLALLFWYDTAAVSMVEAL